MNNKTMKRTPLISLTAMMIAALTFALATTACEKKNQDAEIAALHAQLEAAQAALETAKSGNATPEEIKKLETAVATAAKQEAQAERQKAATPEPKPAAQTSTPATTPAQSATASTATAPATSTTTAPATAAASAPTAPSAPNPAYAAARPVRPAVSSAPLAPVANQGNPPAQWVDVSFVTFVNEEGGFSNVLSKSGGKSDFFYVEFHEGKFLVLGNPFSARSGGGAGFYEEIPNFESALYANGRFVTARNNGYGEPASLLYSADRAAWTEALRVSTGMTNITVDGLAYGGGRFLAYTREFRGREFLNRMFSSADGIRWAELAAPPGINPRFGADGNPYYYGILAIAYGGGRWVFSRGVNDGTANTTYLGYLQLPESSGPNASWAEVITADAGDRFDISRIVYGNGRFVVAGSYDTTKFFYSDDGITWTQAADSPLTPTALVYGGGWFVAGGSNGKIAYSSDGNKWTLVADSTLATVRSIAYGERELSTGKVAQFVAVGGKNIAASTVLNTQTGRTSEPAAPRPSRSEGRPER